ncbi:UMP-CMP kinase 2, mitochondrial [Gastrophryne carolinensis]
MPGWRARIIPYQLLLHIRSCFRNYTAMNASGNPDSVEWKSRVFAVEASSYYSHHFYFTSKDNIGRVHPATSNIWPILAQGGKAYSLSVTLAQRVQAARLHKTLVKELSKLLPGIPVLKLISYIPGDLHGSLERGFLILDPQSCSDVQIKLYSLLRDHRQLVQLCSYKEADSQVWQELNGLHKVEERTEVVRVNDPVLSPFVEILKGSAVYSSLNDALSVLDESSTVIPEAKKLLNLVNMSNWQQKRSFPVIVVEGLDATGKSTLTESLKQHLKAALLRSPPDSVSQCRKNFDGEPSLIKRAYYSLGNYIGSLEIANASEKSPVIVDRFWHSTAAYAIATEIGGDIQNLPDHHHDVYHWPEDLIKPDLVILLTVTDTERIRRIRKRGLQETQEEIELEVNSLFRQKVEEAYRRMENPGCIVVDASVSKEAVLQEALSIIQRHCGISQA